MPYDVRIKNCDQITTNYRPLQKVVCKERFDQRGRIQQRTITYENFNNDDSSKSNAIIKFIRTLYGTCIGIFKILNYIKSLFF